MYFHEGPYLQIESTRRRAAEDFRRSVALDSASAPLGHLLEVALLDVGLRSAPHCPERRAADA